MALISCCPVWADASVPDRAVRPSIAVGEWPKLRRALTRYCHARAADEAMTWLCDGARARIRTETWYASADGREIVVQLGPWCSGVLVGFARAANGWRVTSIESTDDDPC